MKNMFKAISLLALVAGAQNAQAEWKTSPGGCAGHFLGDCTEYSQDGTRVGPNFIKCKARDASNKEYFARGRYIRPSLTKQKAIDVCKAKSASPSSCRFTVCVWAD